MYSTTAPYARAPASVDTRRVDARVDELNGLVQKMYGVVDRLEEVVHREEEVVYWHEMIARLVMFVCTVWCVSLLV